MPRNSIKYPALIAALALISVGPAGAQAQGSTNQWTSSGRSPLVRGANCSASPCAVLTDGRTLMAPAGSASLELYDPSSGKSASYPSPRAGVVPVTLPSGGVLLIGGTVQGAASRAVDVFDPATHAVSRNGMMLTARTGFSATALRDGSVVIAGGLDNSGNTLASVEIYDHTAGSSIYAGEMLAARHDHAASLLPDNNQVLLAGGADGDTVLASAELFTPWTGASAAPDPSR